MDLRFDIEETIKELCEEVQELREENGKLREDLAELSRECRLRWTVECKRCHKVATEDRTQHCQKCRQAFFENFETSPFAMTQILEMDEIQ